MGPRFSERQRTRKGQREEWAQGTGQEGANVWRVLELWRKPLRSTVPEREGEGLNQWSQFEVADDMAWGVGEVRVLGALTIVDKENEKMAEEEWSKVRGKKTFRKKIGERKSDKKKAAVNRNRYQALSIIKVIEPDGINRMELKDGWDYADFAVDSGASETVVGEEMLQSVATTEGVASRRGVQYEVANGVRIPNLGENKLCGISGEVCKRNITAQVCEVNKALLSVQKVEAAGNKVVFDNEGAYSEDKVTVETLWMIEEGGMYMLRMWVKAEGFRGGADLP